MYTEVEQWNHENSDRLKYETGESSRTNGPEDVNQ